MARYGWPRERWRERLPKKAQQIHDWAVTMSGQVSYLYGPEAQKVLSLEAKKYLFTLMPQLPLTDQRSLVYRLREGLVCIDCLNNGKGFQLTAFDPEPQVYVCRRCGVEQSPEPFAARDGRVNSSEKHVRLKSPLPSGIRASLILE